MIDSVRLENIFDNIPENFAEELIDPIAEGREVRIERVVSRGHASPPGYWYDQKKNEYVLLIKGKAGLVIEGQKETIVLQDGDYINIPAHLKHRVEWTDPDQDTVWLAIHY
jgi:cupin 2 domain-containing protein